MQPITTDKQKFGSAEIYADIKSKLTVGKFLQGSKLRAERLRLLYNCSASTVRETFMKLSFEGHLEAIEQKGFRVPLNTPESRRDLIQMRLLLEKEGAQISFKDGGLEWESQLAASYHQLAHIEQTILQSGKVSPYVGHWNDAEYAFHKSIIGACHSKLMIDTHYNIYNRFRQQLVGDDTNFGFDVESTQEHRLLFDAAIRRDFEAFLPVLARHINKDLSHRSKLHLSTATS